LAHASLSWSAPVFNGGSPITKYVVTLSAAGKRTVVVNTTSTHLNVGGLADATRYNVSIVAVNKTGNSPATSLKVSVA
jgi:large repetitive protein